MRVSRFVAVFFFFVYTQYIACRMRLRGHIHVCVCDLCHLFISFAARLPPIRDALRLRTTFVFIFPES